MTLDEARERIGQKVVYRAPHVAGHQQGDEGVITSVNDHFVFVRYGTQAGSQATHAETLEPIAR